MRQGDAPPASTAAERNKEPILEVLARVLPEQGAVLEIASGTGQHVVHFAAAHPGLSWQPTDADLARCTLIAARVAGLANIRPPLVLDVHDDPWRLSGLFDVIVCINMIHISPPSAMAALVRGARRWLVPRGVLYLYGPFLRGGQHTAPSNEAFDKKLRADNATWGVRDVDELTRLAAVESFGRPSVVPMPVNNFSVFYTLAP